MRTILISLLAIAAACSGSGSQAEPRSADIAATHPWLTGFWYGQITSSLTGLSHNTYAHIDPPASGGYYYVRWGSDYPFLQGGYGSVQAGGSSFWLYLPATAGGTIEVTGTIEGRAVLRGTWRASFPGHTADGDSGTFTLARSGGAAGVTVTVEQFDSPQLRLQIVTVDR